VKVSNWSMHLQKNDFAFSFSSSVRGFMEWTLDVDCNTDASFL
jgi:hypothetical protein